jgi:branched-chain amino acid transport system substrate-binding protein
MAAPLTLTPKVRIKDYISGVAPCNKMRVMPVNDFYVRNGHLREDGRLVHDMYFAQVKTPAESTGPWDYYKILATIPGDQAFRPMAEAGCPLVGAR